MMHSQPFRASPTIFPGPQGLFSDCVRSCKVIILGFLDSRSTKIVIDKESPDIVAWLSPLHFETQQKDVFSRHQEGTGKWMLNSKEFNDWFSESGRTLWCPGIRMITFNNI
jgi:hypothetical protein